MSGRLSPYLPPLQRNQKVPNLSPRVGLCAWRSTHRAREHRSRVPSLFGNLLPALSLVLLMIALHAHRRIWRFARRESEWRIARNSSITDSELSLARL